MCAGLWDSLGSRAYLARCQALMADDDSAADDFEASLGYLNRP